MIFGTLSHPSRRLMTVLILCGFLMAAGCGQQVSKVTEKPMNGQVVILTSFYPVYIMTKNIAGNIQGVQVKNLTSPYNGCLHDYQLTTGDMKKLQNADYLVISGGGTESFLDKVTAQRRDLKIIDAGLGIPKIKGPDGEENPHLWVSTGLAMKQVENISEQLAQADPAHAAQYRNNGQQYISELSSLSSKMHAGLAPLKGQRIVTFHEAFPYFAQEFGLVIAGVIERDPGSEPSAGELANIIKMIKKLKVRAIFAEPQYPAGSAQVIARETGVKVYYLDPAVNGPDRNDAYINIMTSNLKVLEEALGEK
ncbi:MAG: metal ABC transporter substrate-binding protein [Candidatus Saccharibacteria bacterium]